jgi:hypothetical protein
MIRLIRRAWSLWLCRRGWHVWVWEHTEYRCAECGAVMKDSARGT